MKLHQKFVKNSSKNRFFVKTTYLEWPRNHSEHPIWSGIKFPVYRDPQTAILGKIGGFRFKSPHREQIFLLLLFFKMAAKKKAYFSKSPILEIFSRKFLGSVLGLVGLIDAKGILLNLYGHEAVWHKLKKGRKTLKMHFLPVLELMSDSLTAI